MSLFVASTLVAVLTVAFSKHQSALYEREYASRLPTSPTQYGLSPATMRSWFDQGLDVAANLPSIALTAISFLELEQADAPLFEVLVVVVALTAAVGTVVFARPRYAGGFDLFGVSILSAALIVVNIAGIVLAA